MITTEPGLALFRHPALQTLFFYFISCRLRDQALWPHVPARFRSMNRTLAAPFAPSALPDFNATMAAVRLLTALQVTSGLLVFQLPYCLDSAIFVFFVPTRSGST